MYRPRLHLLWITKSKLKKKNIFSKKIRTFIPNPHSLSELDCVTWTQIKLNIGENAEHRWLYRRLLTMAMKSLSRCISFFFYTYRVYRKIQVLVIVVWWALIMKIHLYCSLFVVAWKNSLSKIRGKYDDPWVYILKR